MLLQKTIFCPKSGFQIQKGLKNVGDHPITERYDDEMRQEVIDELTDINWNAIDVLRINHNVDDPGSLDFCELEFYCMKPAYRAAVNCTFILRKYGIDDVHCEIREWELFDLATPRLLEVKLGDSCLDS